MASPSSSGAVGCAGDDPVAHAERDKVEAKWAGKVRPEYHEVAKDGRIYVAGSKASADKIQAGGKFAVHKAAIGFGPNRETVIFEANKDGMEDVLMQEWASATRPRSGPFGPSGGAPRQRARQREPVTSK